MALFWILNILCTELECICPITSLQSDLFFLTYLLRLLREASPDKSCQVRLAAQQGHLKDVALDTPELRVKSRAWLEPIGALYREKEEFQCASARFRRP